MSFLDRFLARDQNLGDAKPGREPAPDAPLRGRSGRGHSMGFLDLEELNSELRHPQGHRVYDQMYRSDGDVRQAIRLSINPILGGTWSVVPPGASEADDRDVEIAAAVQWALFNYMRPNLVGHLQQFLPVLCRSGFAPGEIAWTTAARDGKKLIVPKTIALRLPKSIQRFNQTDDGADLVSIEQFVGLGQYAGLPLELADVESGADISSGGGGDFSLVTLPRRPGPDGGGLVYYRIDAEGDNWEGVSLLRPAYKHWKLKDIIERIDAIAQEREAVGIPTVYPPASATSSQLDAMEQILAAMRTNDQAYVVMPGPKAGEGAPEGTGWLLEIVGFDRTGSGRDPQPSLQYHTNKIAAAFISEFMRLGHGQTGARATAQVQADPFLMSVEALTGIIEQELNDSIVAPMVAFNWPDVQEPPRLQMSLVDSTSLSQLADFVLKLTQVGALMPDEELEDFLRARADMPPVNPKVRELRDTETDDRVRRQVVGVDPLAPTPEEQQQMAIEQAKAGGLAPGPGGAPKPPSASGANKDPYGGNSRRDGRRNTKGPGAKKSGAPAGRAGAGQGAPRGPAKQLDALGGDAPPLAGDPWGRRWFETHVDFDAIDRTLDGQAPGMEDACRDHVYQMARAMAQDEPDSPLGDCADHKPLHDALSAQLASAYDDGASSAWQEFDLWNAMVGAAPAVSLDRGGRDRGRAGLNQRAALAAEAVHGAMRHAVLGVDLARGADPAAMQQAAEQAGLRAAARAGHDHAVAAFMTGRHDTHVALAEAGAGVVGVRYVSKLDHGTCLECANADDGVVRSLDDPVRIARQPPNPMCASMASGHNRCRCIEVFEWQGPEPHQALDAQAAGVPSFLRDVASILTARGMPEERAWQAAKNIARDVCSTGRVRWPGLSEIVGTRTEACAAVAWAETPN